MSANLTDQERVDLAQSLRELIEASRYPFSPKATRWRELLAKLEGTMLEAAAEAGSSAQEAGEAQSCAGEEAASAIQPSPARR